MLNPEMVGSSRAHDPRRTKSGLGVLIALAGCLTLQGCASLEHEGSSEFAQLEGTELRSDYIPEGVPLNEGKRVGLAVTPTPVAGPNTTVIKAPAPVSAKTNGTVPIATPPQNPAPRPLPIPERLPSLEPRWETLPLSLLQKEASPDYRLAPDDILGVWVGGVLGDLNEPPTLRVTSSGVRTTGFGFPVPVRPDGTILLPLVEPIRVEQMTIEQAEKAIRHAYTVGKEILKRGRERRLRSFTRRFFIGAIHTRREAKLGDNT